MSLQDLGAIGELVGSVAVLATLIYLAIQLRVARNHLDLIILENRTAGVRESHLAIATNESLATALNKADHMQGNSFRARIEAENGLSDLESLQVMGFIIAQTRHSITQFLTITDAKHKAMNDVVLKQQYARGLHRVFWQEMISKFPESFDPEYVEHVRKLLGEES